MARSLGPTAPHAHDRQLRRTHSWRAPVALPLVSQVWRADDESPRSTRPQPQLINLAPEFRGLTLRISPRDAAGGLKDLVEIPLAHLLGARALPSPPRDPSSASSTTHRSVTPRSSISAILPPPREAAARGASPRSPSPRGAFHRVARRHVARHRVARRHVARHHAAHRRVARHRVARRHGAQRHAAYQHMARRGNANR